VVWKWCAGLGPLAVTFIRRCALQGPAFTIVQSAVRGLSGGGRRGTGRAVQRRGRCLHPLPDDRAFMALVALGMLVACGCC
jgi:hypothetical protein